MGALLRPIRAPHLPGMESADNDLTRREFVGAAALSGGLAITAPVAEAQTPTEEAGTVDCAITVNGQRYQLSLDPRVTLLDLLRERLHLTGTKKGCDHGQCGACTVLAGGMRINSCLSLALTHDGETITTIEGLEQDGELHPLQAAFIEYDGFQCGYCTPGQICSAAGLLNEVRGRTTALSDSEIRERMSGNICRCGAYPNIVAAVRAVQRKVAG
jgi:xanthine dehydrogenase YagT iron-sulfur-binding subunit